MIEKHLASRNEISLSNADNPHVLHVSSFEPHIWPSAKLGIIMQIIRRLNPALPFKNFTVRIKRRTSLIITRRCFRITSAVASAP